MIHALLATHLAPVPVGTRLTYTVKGGGQRVKGRNLDTRTEVEVVGHEPRRVVVLRHPFGTIRAEWPEWWQDGTLREVGT